MRHENSDIHDRAMTRVTEDGEAMGDTQKQNPPARRMVMIEKGFFYSFNAGNKPPRQRETSLEKMDT